MTPVTYGSSHLDDLIAAMGAGAPRPLAEDWDWQVLGRCRRLEPDMFFPEEAGRVGLRAREEAAKRICRGCPVLAECRRHALAMRETHGVWGAMSAAERARYFITAGAGPVDAARGAQSP